MALFAQLQGPIEFELDEAGVPRMPEGQEEPAVAQNALALVRHLQAMPQVAAPQPAQVDETAWALMLQTLTPEQRLIVESFENRTMLSFQLLWLLFSKSLPLFLTSSTYLLS
jgi:hypothetical protein